MESEKKKRLALDVRSKINERRSMRRFEEPKNNNEFKNREIYRPNYRPSSRRDIVITGEKLRLKESSKKSARPSKTRIARNDIFYPGNQRFGDVRERKSHETRKY